ncbi:MAG TPA: RidA family protein [Nitrososphaera sp.]|jgi:enamine deaminase RidA (YjgF/YER057c/UK114 family)
MIEEKLDSLGISLPVPPFPAGSYLPVIVSGKIAFVSGQIPVEGDKIKFKGKVASVETGQQAARLCALNALAQLRQSLGSLDRVKQVIKLTGYVNCEPSFSDHPKVINGASELLTQLFDEKGKHARVAVGVSSLPLDSSVEVDLIVEIN